MEVWEVPVQLALTVNLELSYIPILYDTYCHWLGLDRCPWRQARVAGQGKGCSRVIELKAPARECPSLNKLGCDAERPPSITEARPSSEKEVILYGDAHWQA
jgi:hypothetical protein